ncbi:MAG: hypothetical protein ACPG5B_11670 [Chitinophagales bacterium]
MKLENITNNFSYKDNLYPPIKFSDSNYVLVVRDEEYPDRNILPILYYHNRNIQNIDDYDMEKIITTPNNKSDKPPISERFSLNQLIKISYGTIIDNERWYEGSYYPKCITFHTNLNPFQNNEIIEVFDGEIDESKSRIKLNHTYLDTLIIDLYFKEEQSFFIQNNNRIVGPFITTNKDSDGYFIVEKSSWKRFGNYELNDKSYLEFTVNNINRKIIIQNYNKLILINELDFKNDKEIIKEFRQKINDKSELNIDVFFEVLQKISKNSSIKIKNHINQNERLKKIIQNSEDFVLSEKELIDFIPKVKSISEKIEKIQDDKFNVSKELEKLRETKRNIEEDKFNISIELEKLKKSKQNIEKKFNIKLKEFEELKGKLEHHSIIKKQNLLTVKSSLEEEIKNLKQIYKKNKLEKEIKSKELEDLKAERRFREKDRNELEIVINNLRKDNLDAQKNAQIQLIELFKHKKHFDFLSGRDLSFFEEKSNSYRDYSIKDESFDTYSNFRNEVIKILSKKGRHNFAPHFIDNLLISIHQNTLTILAGLPGIGKTSLARILTQIFTCKDKIAEVSVNRGWTSPKDFIGFENPLTNKFHAAPTNIYKILCQLDYEVKENLYLTSPMTYVILDEANLSPIEHYWSMFYNLTDSIATEKHFLEIELGHSISLKQANNLRFLATINYDQTTENLSPRILNRTNIIQIPIPPNTINEISNEDIETLNLSYSKIKDFFDLLDFETKKRNFELNEEINDIYNKIKSLFKELKLPISPRVEISIKRYCFTARNWMREASRPLDYCVAQRLLPMINLQGDKAKKKLNELLKVFEEHDFKVSKEILTKIIAQAQTDDIFEGHYNYFLTLTYA